MRCQHCRKKAGLMALDCKHCNGKYCSSCIVLETHMCKGVLDKKIHERQLIEKSLNSAIYTKKEKLCLSPH
jgi:predicted nucleic acid binding AN1-type Zn finger protein